MRLALVRPSDGTNWVFIRQTPTVPSYGELQSGFQTLAQPGSSLGGPDRASIPKYIFLGKPQIPPVERFPGVRC